MFLEHTFLRYSILGEKDTGVENYKTANVDLPMHITHKIFPFKLFPEQLAINICIIPQSLFLQQIFKSNCALQLYQHQPSPSRLAKAPTCSNHETMFEPHHPVMYTVNGPLNLKPPPTSQKIIWCLLKKPPHLAV